MENIHKTVCNVFAVVLSYLSCTFIRSVRCFLLTFLLYRRFRSHTVKITLLFLIIRMHIRSYKSSNPLYSITKFRSVDMCSRGEAPPRKVNTVHPLHKLGLNNIITIHEESINLPDFIH